MHVFPIIIDSIPGYARACGAHTSLLMLPAGGETLLARLVRHLRRITYQRPAIFPDFDPDPEYARRIHRAHSGCDLLSNAQFSEWAARREPSDLLLLVDPRFCPLGPWSLETLATNPADLRVARFLVAIDESASGAEEWAHLDKYGNVERIQRYYDNVTRVGTRGVFAAALSAASYNLLGRRRIRALARLRSGCGAAEIPCQDIAFEHPMADLNLPRGLLDFNEYCLTEPGGRLLIGFHERAPGVFTQDGARIASGARIIGPVVVHADATIEDKALVVGPAVIGAKALIGRDSIVVQSVVAPGASIARLRSVLHEVAFSAEPEPTTSGAPSRATASSAFSPHTINDPAEFGTVTTTIRPVYEVLKRAFDLTGAVVGLLISSPLLLATALLVKLTSPGPVFFAHRREGRGGRPFDCYKFRTMRPDAHDRQRELYDQNKIDGPQFMIPDDPRVTPIGKFLRKWCIDEIPQLWNVLRGEMSLVGPRPSPFRENQVCIPWRHARLSVLPGITGLWQICRTERSLGDFHQWIHYDILYVRNASFWLDLKIIGLTLASLGGHFNVPVRWLIPRHKLAAWGHLAPGPDVPPGDSNPPSAVAL